MSCFHLNTTSNTTVDDDDVYDDNDDDDNNNNNYTSNAPCIINQTVTFFHFRACFHLWFRHAVLDTHLSYLGCLCRTVC